MIALVYVGKKPFAHDNIARSGKMWSGNGDVQEVTEAQAKQLLKFPDQWALKNAADQASVEKQEAIKVTDEDGDKVTVNPDAFNKPLEKMSKPELIAFAKDKWGKDLAVMMGKKHMIDQIEEWEKDLEVIVGHQTL